MFGVMAPPVAVGLVLVAGILTPGYDPVARTVSRLAAPGMPAAWMAEVAIGVISMSCFSLAIALRGTPIVRLALVVSGATLCAAMIVRLDPASTTSTALHRLASGLAVLALTVAALAAARFYDRLSLGIGVAELALLLFGLAALPTSFPGWGLWERCLLALPLAWIFVMSGRLLRVKATRIVSADETMSANVASLSSTGT